MSPDVPAEDLVIDADAHVVESAHTWDFMDPSESQFRPIPLETREQAGVKLQFWVIDGKVRGFRFPAFSDDELQRRSRQVGRKFADRLESRELGNVDLRLEHMDRTGVDIEVLHNTMFIESATDRAAVEVALCKSWNRWLAEIWKQGKGRLRWSCMAPTLSMTDALDQIRWSRENGACAVLMRPVEGHRLLVDPYFYPIYDEAQKLDMAIAVHIANGNPWLCDLYRHPVPIASTFHRFRIPTVAAFTDVVLSEIPQVFPRLRWGFIEASAQWLPWVIVEARKRFKTLGREWPENFARDYRLFVTCENSDDLPYIVQQAGEDCLVIGTDYGHTDISSDVDAIKIFRERADLAPRIKRKILSDNARALYGL
ncbi:MAG TPA: amidohydrolase family protein [candidate division Zixibacteria bacterium]|nr:amidohydrolase family protein [candidate division Zixibacteria bacterium]